MLKPNFMIVGAQRSGTSSLYNYLRQHPEIYMADGKEPRIFYWMQKGSVRFEDYPAYFQHVQDESLLGEASPEYLAYAESIAPLIAQHIPDVKLIAILRNPVERAYSSYCYALATGREWQSFEGALQRNTQEPLLISYQSVGNYASQLAHYRKTFAPEQTLVLLFEDLVSKPQETLKSIMNFLGLSSDFAFSLNPETNAARYPKYPHLERMLAYFSYGLWYDLEWGARAKRYMRRFRQSLPKQSAYPPMSPEIRAKLLLGYRDEIERLSDLLERDLHHWME